MNQRDRLYVQREWLAWASWVRDGQTHPNVLGYGASPIGALLSGEMGGGCGGKSKAPTWFNEDKAIDTAQKIYKKLPEQVKCSISGVYIQRYSERRVAVLLSVSRHQVRSWLNRGYYDLFDALTTTDKR